MPLRNFANSNESSQEGFARGPKSAGPWTMAYLAYA